MGWRREELWLDADVLWFGESAVVGFALPPLPSYGPVGLAASRQRRDAWKRRRKARATALMLVPAVMAPPALLRSGSASGAMLVEDPPSLTLGVGVPTVEPAGLVPVEPKPKRSPKVDADSEPSPKFEWRNATSHGVPWSGSLIAGTQLPVEGPNWVTWNPVTDSVPNAPSRLYGNERTIRAIVSVIDAYRAANPRAPRVLVGDISFEGGGPMDAHVSHQSGLDVDIYYPRLDRSLREPKLPDAIDRRLSQDLLERFIAAGARMVFVGYATGLRGPNSIVVPYANHENHMHVRFWPRSG
jgi:Penicillin-insensitive murein endopeptidase